MVDYSVRRIPMATAPNFRDLGGLDAGDRRVRRGVIFRSATLARLAGIDVATFESTGITTVYDLRTAGERESSPDALPGGVRQIGLDVLADSTEDIAAGVGKLVGDPQSLVEALANGRAVALMNDSYRNIVSLPSALASYRRLYRDLLDKTRTGAALFHCTTGKDRTGWAAASLLLLLGVDESDVRADYLQSNTDLLPALQPIMESVAAQGVDPSLLMPVLGVREEYLDTALHEMKIRFGDIDGYARTGLRLGTEEIAALRHRFTEVGS